MGRYRRISDQFAPEGLGRLQRRQYTQVELGLRVKVSPGEPRDQRQVSTRSHSGDTSYMRKWEPLMMVCCAESWPVLL